MDHMIKEKVYCNRRRKSDGRNIQSDGTGY